MDNIIEGLVQIEKEAKNIILQAEEDEKKIIAEADAKLVSAEKQISSGMYDELKKMETQLKEEFDFKIRELNRNSANKIEILRKNYQDNHEKWEQDIFEKTFGR